MEFPSISLILFSLITVGVPYSIFWWARKMIHLKKENNELLRELIEKMEERQS